MIVLGSPDLLGSKPAPVPVASAATVIVPAQNLEAVIGAQTVTIAIPAYAITVSLTDVLTTGAPGAQAIVT